MKSGIAGLILAAVLGLLAVALNWFYLENKAKSFKTVSFIGVKDGVTIKVGEPIREQHVVEVKIPAAYAENLEGVAFKWDRRESYLGMPATREHKGGDLLYRRDYRTPPLQLPVDDVVFVRINSASFVPELADPGDQISFIVPPEAGSGGGQDEMIGPFTIVSIGNRFYSREVMKAYGISQQHQEDVGLLLEKDGDKPAPKVLTLLARLRSTGGRDVSVLLSKKS